MRFALLVWFCTATVFAWDRHDWITEASLQSLTLADAAVPYEPLDAALKRPGTGLQARDVDGFLKEFKLNSSYVFENKLNEEAGGQVFVKAILSRYADEPDRGADQNLFEADQFPELWTEDTPYVSQRTGLGSQGFRHMYFPGTLNWWEPINSFQIPLKPIGRAPYRAQLYWNLAQAMDRAGSNYWRYRFLAWALHYVQDLFQPFHSRQTPSKAFIQFKLKWLVVPGIDIEATADQIAYYHLGYEAWVTRQFEKEAALKQLLNQGTLPEENKQTVEVYLKETVVPFAASKAADLGETLRHVLPEPKAASSQKPKDSIGTAAWWEGVKTGDRAQSLLKLSGELFDAMGKTTRYLVQTH